MVENLFGMGRDAMCGKGKEEKMKNKMLAMGSKAAINNNELLELKYFVDKDPNLYLDKTVLQFPIKTGKYSCHRTIWNYLHGKLGYSLRVLSDVALQRNKEQEERFMAGLTGKLQGCPECLIVVDKIHLDQNTARRRRGWKKKNSSAENNEWYRVVCNTL